MSDIVRVIIIGKTVREAQSYYGEHRDSYAGLSVQVMSVELAVSGRLSQVGRGVRLDVMPRAAQHKESMKLEQVIRQLREARRVEVRWCPSGSV